jgi:hypothetical protein
MSDFTDALGMDYLPPPPLDPGLLPGAATPATAAAPPGLDVPLKPPAATPPPTAAASGVDLRQILGLLQPQPPQGVFSPNSQFMAALGAGLNSAGQNWNKPALAAFASGAGAALQGGQQWNNQQQDAKLKALHAAIAAWKTGDIGAYHQALIDLRAAAAPSPAAPPSGAPALPPAVPDASPPPIGPASPRRVIALSAPHAIVQGRDAIARGAPRDAVIKRLREHGIDPSGL